MGRSFSLWRADYSLESPLLPKSPRCRWAACLISTDYSLIGVLQNTMTSALFTDGINHSLPELEIPTEFIPSSLFGGCIAQSPPLSPLCPSTHPASSCWMLSARQIISDIVPFLWKRCVTSGVNLGRHASHLLDIQVLKRWVDTPSQNAWLWFYTFVPVKIQQVEWATSTKHRHNECRHDVSVLVSVLPVHLGLY